METYRELCFDFPEEFQSLKSEVHEFGSELIRPAARTLDGMKCAAQAVAPDSPFWIVLKAAYGMRYHAAMIPQRFGGLGLSGLGIHVLLEELGWSSAGFALGLLASNLPLLALLADGDSSLIDRFVRPFAASRDASHIGCWAVSEPRHGSDYFFVGSEEFRDPTGAAQVVAYQDGDHYVLNGPKAAWITNGPIATYALCSVAVESADAVRVFAIVPLTLPGVERGEPLGKFGQRDLFQGAIHFNQARIPLNFVLQGERYEDEMARLVALACSATAAVVTGTARACFEEALDHTTHHVQGGAHLSTHQMVRHQLFDLYTQVEACRAVSRSSLIHNFTAAMPSLENAIAAKNFCSRAAFQAADAAMQLFGGRAIASGHFIEKLFRDTRVALTQQGSNDVLGLVGAGRLL